MKSQKRGQAAIEYLVTYGWVFIVIIATIAALSYFDLLSPSQYLPNSCDFGQQMSCVDQYIDTNGVVVLRFKNLFDANITISDAYMFNVSSEQMDSVFHGVVGGAGGPVTIGQNEIGRVQVNLFSTPSEGSKERARIVFTFARQGGSNLHNLSGSVFGEVSSPLI